MRQNGLRAAAAGVALLLLAGCGGTAAPAASQAAEAAATGGATAPAQTVELTFDYPVGVSGPLATIMTNLTHSFNSAHPGIHVTPVFAGSYQQTLAKVETAIQAGNPPDLAVVNHTAIFDLLHLQAIQPLDDVVSQGNFYPAMLKPEVQGHYWSVPFQRSTVVLYYNKDLFQQAGLDPSKGPATWDELVTDAKAIQSKTGVTGIEIPSDGTVYWVFQPFAIAAGQNLAADDGTTVNFNAPAVTTALQFWMDLSHKYKVEPTGILPWNTVPNDFEAGKAAMIVHSSGSLASILQNSKFQVGVAFMPADTATDRSNLGGGDFYLMKGIPASHQQAALTFIRWMTAPAQAASWSMQTGYVAVTPDAYQTPDMKAYTAKNPQALVAAQQLQYAEPELSTYQLNQIQDTFDSAVQSVLDGQATIPAALGQAQQQAQGILAPFK
ncbi:MAG TPA: ABC transporter substrate-binding protein [Bacillota bacterium]|nr:ABC transporter substrate-binding protein [Bacillota bacterium]